MSEQNRHFYLQWKGLKVWIKNYDPAWITVGGISAVAVFAAIIRYG